ncbi:MAG: pyruvate kinase [Acidobacteriota bacterium]
MYRRAKIVGTIGPASADETVLGQLLDAGLNVVRLNLSHGSHETHRKIIRSVRKLGNDKRIYVPIIVDLKGPRYRIGQLATPLELEPGDEIFLGAEGADVQLPVENSAILGHLRPGERVLIDNGLLELRVEAVEEDRVRTEVITGGPVSRRKGINLPDTSLPFEISEKDRRDIAFGIEEGVEYFAVSFVGGPDDLSAIRKVVELSGGVQPLISKLERATVMRNLEATIDASDAVMVARGDLGVEVPIHQVPVLQKKIVTIGRRLGKPVIVATQMLESMMERPRPTRAESTDVANAVFDGADALMLSGETAAGSYPVETVRTMAEIILEAEAYQRDSVIPSALGDGSQPIGELYMPLHPGVAEREQLSLRESTEIPEMVTEAGVYAAGRLGVRHIVAFSQSGFTARMVARYRPRVPIIVFANQLGTARRVQLVWGARPIMLEDEVRHHDEVVQVVDRTLIKHELAEPGDIIMVMMGDPISERALTNLIRVHRVRG